MENKNLEKELVRKYLKRANFSEEEIEKALNGPAYRFCKDQVLAAEKALQKINSEFVERTTKKGRR